MRVAGWFLASRGPTDYGLLFGNLTDCGLWVALELNKKPSAKSTSMADLLTTKELTADANLSFIHPVVRTYVRIYVFTYVRTYVRT